MVERSPLDDDVSFTDFDTVHRWNGFPPKIWKEERFCKEKRIAEKAAIRFYRQVGLR